MTRPDRFGSGDIFVTQDNFDRYRITTLLEKRAADLGNDKRLALLGHGNFRADHQQAHERLDRLKVPHEYHDGPQRKHAWDSGWVAEAVEFLAGPVDNDRK
jgi:hypothetical protein